MNGRIRGATATLVDTSRNIDADFYRAQAVVGILNELFDVVKRTSEWTFEDETEAEKEG